MQAESCGQQGSPEAPEPYGMPWRIAVNMAATNLRPAQTYAIRATEGFTVRTLDKDSVCASHIHPMFAAYMLDIYLPAPC